MRQEDFIKSVFDIIRLSINIPVYEYEAPSRTQLPYCTFTIVADAVVSKFSCIDNFEATLQVNFFGKRNTDTQALRVYADDLYEGITNTGIVIDSNYELHYGYVLCTQKGRLERTSDTVMIRQDYVIKI